MSSLGFSRLAFSADFHLDPETQLSSLMRRIRRLSAPHQATLKALCTHLAKIASYEKENKMTSTNLGLVFRYGFMDFPWVQVQR